MTNFPPCFALSCASQVSCVANVEVVSDSAKFRMTSRKEGMDPVVIAFTLGIVIVGDAAWAVKGSAAPSRIKLHFWSTLFKKNRGTPVRNHSGIPLYKIHAALLSIDEVAPQRVDNHENQLVKGWRRHTPFFPSHGILPT